MGGAGSKCCGSSGAIAKAKEDKYIDEIEYEVRDPPASLWTPAWERNAQRGRGVNTTILL